MTEREPFNSEGLADAMGGPLRWDDWTKTCGAPTVFCGFDWPVMPCGYVVFPSGSYRDSIIEECATRALEQRCERGTPWDAACLVIAESIRGLKDNP